VLAAIRDGNAYVNIHTEANGGGEIRGQLAGGGGGGTPTTPPTDGVSTAPTTSTAMPAALLVVLATLGLMAALARFAVTRRT